MRVEYPRGSSIAEYFSLLHEHYTEYEWENITRNNSDHQQLVEFYCLWCLKESFIKAVGIGLGFLLNRMEFHYIGEEEVIAFLYV